MFINDLPLDIIQEIFTSCCGRAFFRIVSDNPVPRNKTTQEIVSLVCSKWREIALSTSEMWNSVTLIHCTHLGADLDRVLQAVQMWLNRAGTSPISLSIFVFGFREPDVRKIRQALFSFPIRDLDLESMDCTLPIPSNASYILEKLSITYELSDKSVKRVKFPLPNLPSLKVLRLFLHPSDFTSHKNLYKLPWHQLTVFDNSRNYWPFRLCLRLLRHCRSLVQCTFWMFVPEKPQPGVEDDIVLPNLELLSLHLDWRGGVDHILRALILPSIKSLDIISRRPKIPLDPTSVEMIARRSGFEQLTTFSMPNTSNSVNVDSLLQCMPALRSIELDGPLTFDHGTFQNLSLGIIGPHLEDIQFKGLNGPEIMSMLKAIRERQVYAKPPSQIKHFTSVVLYCSHDSDVKTLGEEAELCSEELNMRIIVVSPVVF